MPSVRVNVFPNRQWHLGSDGPFDCSLAVPIMENKYLPPSDSKKLSPPFCSERQCRSTIWTFRIPLQLLICANLHILHIARRLTQRPSQSESAARARKAQRRETFNGISMRQLANIRQASGGWAIYHPNAWMTNASRPLTEMSPLETLQLSHFPSRMYACPMVND